MQYTLLVRSLLVALTIVPLAAADPNSLGASRTRLGARAAR